MKSALLSVMALVLIIASTVAPAYANGSAHGKFLAISVQGLPDVCPAGESMEGKLMIALASDGTKVRKSVTLEVTVDTPFGDVQLFEQTFKMRPGTEHSQSISIPVPSNVPPGEYYFDFNVWVRGERLNVGHEVVIVPK